MVPALRGGGRRCAPAAPARSGARPLRTLARLGPRSRLRRPQRLALLCRCGVQPVLKAPRRGGGAPRDAGPERALSELGLFQLLLSRLAELRSAWPQCERVQCGRPGEAYLLHLLFLLRLQPPVRHAEYATGRHGLAGSGQPLRSGVQLPAGGMSRRHPSQPPPPQGRHARATTHVRLEGVGLRKAVPCLPIRAGAGVPRDAKLGRWPPSIWQGLARWGETPSTNSHSRKQGTRTVIRGLKVHSRIASSSLRRCISFTLSIRALLRSSDRCQI